MNSDLIVGQVRETLGALVAAAVYMWQGWTGVAVYLIVVNAIAFLLALKVRRLQREAGLRA